jgi:hypothetical protein
MIFIVDIDPSSLDILVGRLESHADECAEVISQDQQVIGQRIIALDEYCAKLSNTIASRVYESRSYTDMLLKGELSMFKTTFD